MCNIDKIIELAESSAKDSWVVDVPKQPSYINDLKVRLKNLSVQFIKLKKKRGEMTPEKTRNEIIEKFNKDDTELHIINDAVKSVEKEVVRASILKTNTRLMGET